MAKKRPYKYRPHPTRRGQEGAERCTTVQSPSGTPLKLCVIGGKYGFAGRLYAKDGKNYLPVSTGRARTIKTAMSAAKQFLRRHKMKSRY